MIPRHFCQARDKQGRSCVLPLHGGNDHMFWTPPKPIDRRPPAQRQTIVRMCACDCGQRLPAHRSKYVDRTHKRRARRRAPGTDTTTENQE